MSTNPVGTLLWHGWQVLVRGCGWRLQPFLWKAGCRPAPMGDENEQREQCQASVHRCIQMYKNKYKKTARSWILTRWIFMLASFYEKAFQETSVVLTRKNTKKVKSVKSTTNMGNCAVFGRMPGRIFGPQDLATFGWKSRGTENQSQHAILFWGDAEWFRQDEHELFYIILSIFIF